MYVHSVCSVFRSLVRWLACLVMLWVVSPAYAQTVPPQQQNEATAAYWQYDAAGEITQIFPIDLQADRFLESLVLTDGTRVELVNAAGQSLWPEPITLEQPIVDIALAYFVVEQVTERNVFDFLRSPIQELKPHVLLLTADSLTAYDAADSAFRWSHLLDGSPLQTITVLDPNTDGSNDIVLAAADGGLTGYQLVTDTIIEQWQWRPETAQTLVALHATATQLLPITQTADGITITPINAENGTAAPGRTLPGIHSASAVIPTFTPPSLAIGTTGGALHLLDDALADRWRSPRTLNVPITTLTPTSWADEPIFITGLATGKVIGWQENGNRQWDQALCQTEEGVFFSAAKQCFDGIAGAISKLSAAPQSASPLAIELVTEQQVHTLLLDEQFDVTAHYPAAEHPLLIDTNQDNIAELLLVNFGTLTAATPGTTNRSTRELWQYRLGSKPRQVINYTLTGRDPELLIAAGESVHLIVTDTGTARWVESFGGDVTQIGLLKRQLSSSSNAINTVVVGYNDNRANNDGDPADVTAYIELINDDGDKIPNFSIPATGGLTALVLEQRSVNDYWLLIGTDSGFVYAYRLTLDNRNNWQARPLWVRDLENPITAISVLESNGSPQFVIATALDLRRVDIVNGSTIYNVNVLDREDEGNTCKFPVDLLYVLENGLDTATCLGDPVSDWRDNLGRGRAMRRIETAFFRYSPLNKSTWRQVTSNSNEETAAPLIQLDNITDFVVNDMTSDDVSDVVLADAAGNLLFDLNTETPQIINYSGEIVAMETLQEVGRESPGLAVVVGNSLVHFLRFLPDNPPLLTAPTYDPETSSIQITVQDIEQSPVDVVLEIRDERNPSWTQQGEAQIADKENTRLTWVIEEPQSDSFEYRFAWGEGPDPEAEKTMLLPISQQLPARPGFAWWLFLPVLPLLLGLWYGIRRFQRADWQGVRLYRDLRQERTAILPKLRERYIGGVESADWLLRLSNRARRRNDPTIAALSDGLFLLENPFNAGLPILREILQEIETTQDPVWAEVREWQQMLAVSDLYLQTPTLEELALLGTELTELIKIARPSDFDVTPFPQLKPIFATLQAAEGVDNVDDRLLYLEDALVQLRDIGSRIATPPPGLPYVLVNLVLTRWLGLINAETEDIRGRARIEATLISTHITPSVQNSLVLELHNSGRAIAENVHVVLEESAEAAVLSAPIQVIPALPSHRSRRVAFPIVPPHADTFRAAFTIQYNDRTGENRTLEYANIVNVLQSPDEFEPVINPYAPGTPLQQNSKMFFGRTSLFNFIAEQAPRLAQQRVLILVGQRRTGKTSALLRLGRHLPSHLIPIYIDCQSLGALPGESGFFQDIVWQVEDAMLERGIDFLAPDLNAIEDNPLTWFKRDFIPSVRENVSADTTLVLVFDEFESFENLVDDGILPRAIFGHLRHLMQHCEGVSFVFVGTHRLEEMTAGYWSVLFNIALYKEIEYLDEGAARALVTQPVSPSIRYDALALDRIWKITAGHPYFLQLVCYSLVKRANANKTGYITVSDVNVTIDEMLALGEVHFAYIWQRSNPIERIILVAVSHLLDYDESFRTADIMRVLKPYSIRLTPAQLTTALDHLVQRNIVQEINTEGIISYEMKIGLVGTWVERTRSLSRLYSESV